jgi:phospholipid/cholesterol/gamma-HCH transport system ATP-binding protein
MDSCSICFQNVSFNYDGSKDYILEDVTVSIEPGQTVFIYGNSGGGKSTFLRLASGLITPVEGEVFINGTSTGKAGKPKLMELHQMSAYVFQDSGLINNMTMYDNLALPLRYHTDLSEGEIAENVTSILKDLGLSKDTFHFPNEMSRGERKLGSVGRTLVASPGIIYYDEPLEGLDYQTARKVREIIRRQKQEKKTLIIIEQDLEFALKIADKIIILYDGKLLFEGTPGDLNQSDKPFIKDLLKRNAVED